MLKNSIIYPAVFFLTVAITTSQQVYFNKTYDFFGDPEGALNVLEVDGGYFVVGLVDTIDSNYWHGRIGVMFIDTMGNSVWKKSYGRFLHYYYPGWSGSFIPTVDGGYALAGSEYDTTGNDDVTLFKFNEAGDSLWSKTFDYSTFDIGSQCKQTPDTGYIIVGSTAITGITEFMLIKTDSIGNEQWMKRYPNADGYGRTLALCNDGGYIIGGNRVIAGNSDAHVVKTDNLGNEQWSRSFGGPYDDGVANVLAASDGGYIIGTDTAHYALGLNDFTQFRVIKLDGAGNTTWDKTYGPVSWGSNVWMIRELSDGSFIITGNYMHDVDALKGVMLKINAVGDSIWWREYKYCENQAIQRYLRDVISTQDGGFIACGFVIDGSCDSNQNMWVMKFDSIGCNAPNCTVGITENSSNQATIKVYPNPFNDFTTFLIEGNSVQHEYSFALYDMPGREIRVIEHISGNKFTIKRNNLAAGIYIYKLYSQSKIISTGKLIIQQ